MRLSDIIAKSNDGSDISSLWRTTEAASEFEPLPPGEYVAHITNGELIQSSRNKTPGYRLTFTVVEGDHVGRRFWHESWLTPAALAQTKRDLAKIGITEPSQMELPIPRGIRCKCKLALRKDDDGNESNKVKKFEVVGIDKPEVDPFAPAEGA